MHESTGRRETRDSSVSKRQIMSSGTARSSDPTQITDSFDTMEPNDSGVLEEEEEEEELVNVWKRSTLRAQRLKVLTPRDVT